MNSNKIIKPHNFKELNVWKESRILVKEIYLLTKNFPKDEKFGLVSQIRRAAISICANIAEGTGRDTENQLLNFLNIAKGSAYEIENLLILCKDLEYLNEQEFISLESQVIKIQNMLYRFSEKIQNDLNIKTHNILTSKLITS